MNYQNELKKLISSLDYKPTLLLHSCCGPCSTQVLSYLAPYFDITVLYYNPNIEPKEEYEHRKEEQIRFINEFNKKLGLALSTEQVDEIIHRDYTNGERWEDVLKTYVDENGEEHSYWTVEDVAKKRTTKRRI